MLRPFFLPLFTQVRGIGILRTSPFGYSRKLDFHFTEFSEVRSQQPPPAPNSPPQRLAPPAMYRSWSSP
jgi:hypothetical protein